MAMKCPICEEIAHTRSSEYLSSQTKRSYMQCKILTALALLLY
ncbi:DNA-binding transcriptional regulator [Providencia rettgeri]|nr:DNA-binding transcriptional regulator [Providencia rettgeri]